MVEHFGGLGETFGLLSGTWGSIFGAFDIVGLGGPFGLILGALGVISGVLALFCQHFLLISRCFLPLVFGNVLFYSFRLQK